MVSFIPLAVPEYDCGGRLCPYHERDSLLRPDPDRDMLLLPAHEHGDGLLYCSRAAAGKEREQGPAMTSQQAVDLHKRHKLVCGQRAIPASSRPGLPAFPVNEPVMREAAMPPLQHHHAYLGPLELLQILDTL